MLISASLPGCGEGGYRNHRSGAEMTSLPGSETLYFSYGSEIGSFHLR